MVVIGVVGGAQPRIGCRKGSAQGGAGVRDKGTAAPWQGRRAQAFSGALGLALAQCRAAGRGWLAIKGRLAGSWPGVGSPRPHSAHR